MSNSTKSYLILKSEDSFCICPVS